MSWFGCPECLGLDRDVWDMIAVASALFSGILAVRCQVVLFWANAALFMGFALCGHGFFARTGAPTTALLGGYPINAA
jgi:hypothetical protein